MKTPDRFYNLAIILAIIGIIALVLFKYVIPGRSQSNDFQIKDFDKITVLDLSGNEVKLADLLAEEESTYCLFFELTNCYSCLFKGIEDLKSLKSAGKPCVGLAVHHMVDEIAGWSANYDFTPFFMLKKESYYEHIQSPVMPVMVKLRKGKVESFRYILP